MSLDGFPGQIYHRCEPRSNFIVRIRDGYFSQIGAGHVVGLTANESDPALQIMAGTRSGACSLAQKQCANIPFGDRYFNQNRVEID